ncbi:MAG: TRAP transporter large permease subunit [Proteobacteria bacterium]|nr:TRAP transporter large permease subunit [Pseudomonadota bacterium]
MVGLWMLLALALLMIATGLPAWMVLIGVSLTFAGAGIVADVFSATLLTALPSRLIGLLEQDLLQALPLYVMMGSLLNRLPLAETLFRVFSRALGGRGAAPAVAGLGLGVMLAPMNGSVGASVAMLSRTVMPRLDASGMSAERSASLVCIASTLGVVVPPSLVLILLGDAMLRAHTEAINATGLAVRVINTQDVFRGALIPAAILLALCALVTWRQNRHTPSGTATLSVNLRDWALAGMTTIVIAGLLTGVTLGYLYAVEAAATGGVALVLFGAATRTLTPPVLREVLRDTMAVTGALFALLVGANVFTLVLRGFGTDLWVADLLQHLGGSGYLVLLVVLLILAACALVLDAFEMIFVVIPVLIPPLLMRVPDATWVAVLTLLILQTSFLLPPFGYAVLMVRHARPLQSRELTRALMPYVAAQLLVLCLVIAIPRLVYHDIPTQFQTTPTDDSLPISDKEKNPEIPSDQEDSAEAMEKSLRK